MGLTAGRRQGLEVIEHLREFVADFLLRVGMTDEAAQKAGSDCVAEIAKLYGGQMLYLPRDVAARVQETHRSIVAQFTGRNHSQLAADFGVSVQTIYKILKANRIREDIGGASTN